MEVKEAGNGYAVAVAVQPDGKIVFGGYGAALGRLLPDGTVDQTFGAGGRRAHGPGPAVIEPHGLALQPDGKIVAAGRVETLAGPPPIPGPLGGTSSGQPDYYKASSHVALVRYRPDGPLGHDLRRHGQGDDPHIGAGRSRSRQFHHHPHALSASGARALALDSQGRIVVGGYTQQGEWEPLVARFTPSGLLDTTFGGAAHWPCTSMAGKAMSTLWHWAGMEGSCSPDRTASCSPGMNR